MWSDKLHNINKNSNDGVKRKGRRSSPGNLIIAAKVSNTTLAGRAIRQMGDIHPGGSSVQHGLVRIIEIPMSLES
jgi:hypothetical protein